VIQKNCSTQIAICQQYQTKKGPWVSNKKSLFGQEAK
jgi:hypothetical protein